MRKNLILFGAIFFSLLISTKVMAATNNPFVYPNVYGPDYYQYFQYTGYSPEPVRQEAKKEEGNTVINNYYYYNDVPSVSSPVVDNNSIQYNFETPNRNTTNNHLSEYGVYTYSGMSGAHPNYLSASAYGSYGEQVNNSRNSSFGFLPNTFFKWVLTILLIFAIVVVFRLIVRLTKKEATS